MIQVSVECIYEPPQLTSAEGFELLEDSREDIVEKLADLLGLKKVGWIFAHPPREEGYQFSSAEVGLQFTSTERGACKQLTCAGVSKQVLMAADLQLVAGQGAAETAFVTVKASVNASGNAHFEAFQVSVQCMEMVAEGALHIADNPGSSRVDDSFTAIVEAKPTKEVR